MISVKLSFWIVALPFLYLLNYFFVTYLDVITSMCLNFLFNLGPITILFLENILMQLFPESLLVQLLKVMLHPDVEARLGAHHIFSVLVIPSSNHPRQTVASLRSGYLYEQRRWNSNIASAFASITARLEKLRKEKDGAKIDHGNKIQDDLKEKEIAEDDWKYGRTRKSSPNFYKLSSIIDRTAGSTCLTESVSTSHYFLVSYECSCICITMVVCTILNWKHNFIGWHRNPVL